MEFHGNRRKELIITVDDQEEIQLCPRCTFPNESAAIICEDCGYRLQGGNVRWVKAALVKRCENPDCGSYYAGNDTTCKKCGHQNGEKGEAEKPQSATITSEPEEMWVCPECGTLNAESTMICKKCHKDVTHIFNELDLVSVDTPCEDCTSVVLSLEDTRTGSKRKLTLPSGGDLMVGQHGFLSDLLQGDNYVSREHFHLFWDGFVVYIKDVSSNGTYINGVRLPKDQIVPLPNGVVIGLGDQFETEELARFFRVSY